MKQPFDGVWTGVDLIDMAATVAARFDCAEPNAAEVELWLEANGGRHRDQIEDAMLGAVTEYIERHWKTEVEA